MKTESKFTPGPWEGNGAHVIDKNGFVIAIIMDTENKAIIAAAPDMYEALKFCQSVIKAQGMFDLSERMAFDKAESALKKANP